MEQLATSASGSTTGAADLGELPDEVGAAWPLHLEAVGEAQVAASGSVDACGRAGRALAAAGVSVGEGLDRLRTVSRLAAGREPAYAEVHALVTAWEDHTLAYLHRLSCEDPMTGLATHAHVRSRLGELYRAGGDVSAAHALVVVDAGAGAGALSGPLRRARLGQTARTVFPAETVGTLGPGRLVVLADRSPRLPARVRLLGALLGQQAACELWVELLPEDDLAAVRLLDELVRG